MCGWVLIATLNEYARIIFWFVKSKPRLMDQRFSENSDVFGIGITGKWTRVDFFDRGTGCD